MNGLKNAWRRMLIALLVGMGAVWLSRLALTVTAASYPEPASSTSRSTLTAAAPFTQPFPRLGMWWPDTWSQPLTDIARYDWVIFGNHDRDHVVDIKAINPQLLALNATNACELAFDPSPNPPAWSNVEVRTIPPQWFLTQVGTTLVSAVNTTTQILPVAAVTTTDGTTTYDLFVVGDAILIDGESALVTNINLAAKTLTVQRGYVRSAAAHPIGTRVAAHISFWPNSWLLNLSTLSPRAIVSSSIGPERWADYHARTDALLLSEPVWDGLLIDRSDPDESWLIDNSTARTIDPDQSNHLITDYAQFDATWNAGLRAYEARLRQLIGPEKLIYANWGMPNYDLLNGNNFEGFPRGDASSYSSNWRQTVFGPWPGAGSYFEWLRQAQQPNLTMIETYEDDNGADPTGDGGYDNPCVKPGFVPDYRKMRFGLTTALLGDGFFSYEINTNGHGSLCLLWFDEYDNAGQGRGYLGQPLGTANRAIDALTTPNQLSGGDFENQADLDQWDLWADTGYAATFALDSGAARISVTQAAGVDWQVSFSFAPITIVSGTDYALSFFAKADRARNLSVWVQQNQSPWEGWADFGSAALTTTWQKYEVAGTATGSDPAAILHFGLGESIGTVWLDDVRLQVGSREVWRRDFVNGVSLVNASNSAQAINLGAAYQLITGTQAPSINIGQVVTTVTLPPRDGLIALRRWTARVYLPVLLKH
ncbi:MAG: carbohydrate binding domain-containing protein [Thermoflexales bacterium]|nr:carbohydrate binding domain-containing protein [Thermoflexales bacterium]